MEKLDNHLKVFDAECHTLGSLLNSEKQSLNNGSGQKPNIKRVSRYNKSNPKIKTGRSKFHY